MKTLLLAAFATLALATSPAFSHTPTPNHPLNGTQMAITDGTFDAAEFEAAVTANPALLAHVRPGLTKLGFTPYTTAEFDAALGTKIGEKISEVHTAYDKDIFEATGLTKEGTEKSYDYMKRGFGTLKSVATPLQTKIAELERQIAQGSGDATLKAQLEALQTKEAENEKKLTEAETRLFQKDVMLDVRDGQRELKYDPTVKESVRKILVDDATAKIVAMAKVQQNADGTTQIVYVKDGKTILGADAKTPADAAFILKESLKDVLDAGHSGKGGGAGSDDPEPKVDASGNVTPPATRPAEVKTRTAVREWLLKCGLKNNTKEFDTAYATHSAGLPSR